MWLDYFDYVHFELTLNDGSISSIKNCYSNETVENFPEKLIRPNVPKLYLVRDDVFFQYVGTTFQPLNKRLNQGLKANGESGYHGYKWKTQSKVELFVWTFDGINKTEIENIEAELVFKIREQYGRWPLSQNEIHFNNDFFFGKALAEDILKILEIKHSLYSTIKRNQDTEYIFEDFGRYGLRGDPYLLKELKTNYEFRQIENESEFKEFLTSTFKKITGEEPKVNTDYFVDRYLFGGMSSGAVACDFWLEDGFPELINRFRKIRTTTNK